MMIYHVILILFASSIANGLPRQTKQMLHDDGQKLYDEPTLKREQRQQQPEQQQQSEKQQQQQSNEQIGSEKQQQPGLPYGLAYLEQQFQHPDFNFLDKKPLYPRVQPQIVFYGHGGQGQPILINPGSPPGNFLVPHQPQPGPNVIIRDSPQRPFFVAGYPKPAHIPPIEKDAEEIPTNPARIPPFPSPSARKPEKLETFNEDPINTEGEAGVLAGPDRNRPLIPGTNLKPGHRFFILNGEDLFSNYPFQRNAEVDLKYTQPQNLQTYHQRQILPQQKEFDFNTLPFQTIFLNQGTTDQISNIQDLSQQEKIPENLIALNQVTSPQGYFRSNLPLNVDGSENIQPTGQFRFAPPNEPYFSLEGDDFENDAVVIDANADDVSSGNDADSNNEATSSPQKVPEPSTAQAAPGAIALAGPGGVAGAAPRGTALVGRGGLAVSSPQATAVAGTRKNEDKNKKPANKEK